MRCDNEMCFQIKGVLYSFVVYSREKLTLILYVLFIVTIVCIWFRLDYLART